MERGWNAEWNADGTRMERRWNADWQGWDVNGTVMESRWNVDPKKETISSTFEGPIRITLIHAITTMLQLQVKSTY